MRKSDHSTVLRRGVAGMVILLLLFGAFAPAAMAQTWPRCVSGCTANDVEVNSIWLDIPGSCTPGDTVTTDVWMNLYFHRTNTYCIVVAADLYEDGVPIQSNWTSSIISSHSGGGSYSYNMGTVDWTCGKTFEMRNILVMWLQTDPGAVGCSGTCTDYTTPAKCTKYPSFIVTTPLVTDFEATTVCYCTDTQFTDKTTGGLPPYYFSWDFNNNGTYEIEDSLTAANPSYHYDNPGTPTAKLRVKDSNATTNIDYQTHDVTVKPNPTVSVADVTVYEGDDATFEADTTSSPCEVTSYQWYKNDVIISGATSSSYTIEDVTLAMSDDVYKCVVECDNGCSAEDSGTLTVYPVLSLTCDVSPNPTKVGHLTDFTASASGGVLPYTYAWDFGDGIGTSTDEDPSYTYATAGTYEACVNVTDSLGNEEQCCITMDVREELSVVCDVDPNPTKVGHLTDFTASASDGVPPYTYAWDFGDGIGTSTDEDPSYTYATAGTYEACVNVTDSLGNEEQCCISMDVREELSVVCDVDPNPTKVGHETEFSSTASDGVPPYTYAWDFGDGIGTSTDEDPSYTYATAGTYEACVNVTDSLGNEEQCCISMDVREELSVVCDVDPNPTKVGHLTDFTASASDGVGPYTYAWDFGDGIGTSTDEDPSYTYATAGTYEACVNVTDSLGNEEQCCISMDVREELSVVCDVDPNPTKVGHETEFSSTASDGVPPYTYAWDFGDGIGTSTDEDPSYTYATAGTYEACVNVTDSLGNEEQCCISMDVREELSVVCDVDPNPTKVGHETEFSSTASDGVPPYTYLWDFGDGVGTSTDEDPSYTYATAGTYEACVNVTDSLGNEEQCCISMDVREELSVVCDVDPNPTKVGHETEFSSTASDGVPPYTYAWDFGDGIGTSTDEDPSYTYATAGTYEACVNVTDSLGNEEQCCISMDVREELSVVCDVDPNPTKVGHETEFSSTASDGVPPYTYAWDFGDGIGTSTDEGPSYTYATAGTYEACVNVTDSLGNEEQCCISMDVREELSVVCDVDPNPTKVGHETEFSSTASDGVGPYTYLWDFGDGIGTSTDEDPTYTYATAGTYEACVTVTDFLLNTDVCCIDMDVREELSVVCDVDPNPTKVGHLTDFTASASDGVPPYLWSWTVDGTEVATTQNTAYTFDESTLYVSL